MVRIGAAQPVYRPGCAAQCRLGCAITTERLALLTLEEAHDVLRLLLLVAEEGKRSVSAEVDRMAREFAARIPSED